MAPPPVSTSQPLNTSTSVDHPNHTSINQQSRFKPHSSSTVAKNRHRSLLKPSRKPPPPSQTPRTLFSPVVTTPPNLSPAIRTFAKPQTTPYYPTHPLSSTPYTSSQQSSSHNHGHSETGSQRPFTPLLPPISFNTSGTVLVCTGNVQWNSFIMDSFVEQVLGPYTEVTFVRRLTSL